MGLLAGEYVIRAGIGDGRSSWFSKELGFEYSCEPRLHIPGALMRWKKASTVLPGNANWGILGTLQILKLSDDPSKERLEG